MTARLTGEKNVFIGKSTELSQGTKRKGAKIREKKGKADPRKRASPEKKRSGRKKTSPHSKKLPFPGRNGGKKKKKRELRIWLTCPFRPMKERDVSPPQKSLYNVAEGGGLLKGEKEKVAVKKEAHQAPVKPPTDQAAFSGGDLGRVGGGGKKHGDLPVGEIVVFCRARPSPWGGGGGGK